MTHTFLAANTAKGFYSLFDELTQLSDHNIFLIKGGPGTGKSSLMKRISQAAEQKGYETEYIHCSSDCDSLDGIYVKDKKLIFLDATAPHCVDPKYAGAVEQILPLGEFWDRKKLIKNKAPIMALSHSISSLFANVYRLLAAVGEVRAMSDKIIKSAFLYDKAEGAIQKFFRQQALVPLGKSARVQRRFVSAVSGKGHIFYDDIFMPCKHILVIEDTHHSAALITDIAKRQLLRMGYDITLLSDPLCPDKTEHIIVNDCALAIVTQNAHMRLSQEAPVVKTLSARSFLSAAILSEHKNKLAFAKKMTKALYDEVFEYMKSEKALHDELEKYYIEAMDFTALGHLTERLIAENL